MRAWKASGLGLAILILLVWGLDRAFPPPIEAMQRDLMRIRQLMAAAGQFRADDHE